MRNHGSIAACRDLFQDAMFLYMVADYYAGLDWRFLRMEARRQNVELNETWYKALFQQAWDAVAHLHLHAINHCDLKEDNIMVKHQDFEHPDVVIIDFGLSEFILNEQHFCGTPGYIPPETWKDDIWYPTGDVFSLGVVCVQMMLPETAPGKPVKIFKPRCGDLQAWERKVSQYEPMKEFETMCIQNVHLKNSLMQCLAKDRQKRCRASSVLQSEFFTS